MGLGNRILRSWRLGWSGLRIIWNDKTLLGFPAVTVAAIVAILSLVYVVIGPNLQLLVIATVTDAAGPANSTFFYSLLLIWYFLLAFIAVFMHVALVGAIHISMNQRDSKFGDGIGVAVKFVPSIILWTLMAYTFGFLLTLLDVFRPTSKWVRKIFGAAWSVITFLAVPIMVVEKTNIFKALTRSNKLMEKTWGENIHPAFSLGYFFTLLNVPTIIYCVVVYFQPGQSHFLLELLGAMYFLLTMVMIQASRSVLMVALYEYAETGKAPERFDANFMKVAFVPWETKDGPAATTDSQEPPNA